jgi:branched-subunit amino acid transport protein
MPQVPSPRVEFIAGIRALAPMSMSIIPFGIVCGAAASGAGMTPAQALRYVPPAVMAAIIAPPLFFAVGAPTIVTRPAALPPLLWQLIAWRARSSILLTVVLGMLALWGLQALLG